MTRADAAKTGAVAVCLVIVTMYGIAGVSTGVTVDNDSNALIRSFESILMGIYQPSRTTGYPLFEYAGAGLYGLGGVRLVMTAALALVLLGLILLVRPTRALHRTSGLIAWISLALAPAVMTNSSAVMETALLFFLTAALAFLLSSESLSTWPTTAGLSAICAALVLARPDAVLLVIATAIALVVHGWKRNHRLDRLMAASLIGGIVGLVVGTSITGRLVLSSGYLPQEDMVRRILRAGIGVLTAFGPFGAVAVVVLTISLILFLLQPKRQWNVGSSPAPVWDIRFAAPWALGALALYGARFVLLPDEVEYLIPLFVVLAVVAPTFLAANQLIGSLSYVVVLSTTATGLVTVSFLDRSNPWSLEPAPHLALSHGAWAQDLRMRQAASVRNSSEYQLYLTESLGVLASDVEDGTAALMPRNSWHFVFNPGYRDYYARVESIVSCDQLTTEVLIPAWRVSQPEGEFRDVTTFREGRPLSCDVVATLTPQAVTPVNQGVVTETQTMYPR